MNSPSPANPAATPINAALLACRVFEQEIALHANGAEHIVEARYFDVGLHDHPEQMRALLQPELDAVDARPDIEVILMAYGLCGRGTAGLRPLRHRLVIPRAHDCITVFMGSKEACAEHQRRCPACYYYTPGWNRSRRVPGPDKIEAMRAELATRFESDDVDYLIDTERRQWALHDTASFLDLGTNDAETEAAYAKQCADSLGWKFERLRGDPGLLRDLLWCTWDNQRFQIIEPGMQLAQSPDENVMRAEPDGTTPPSS